MKTIEDFEKEKAGFLTENSTIKKVERFMNKVNNNEFYFIETPYKKLNEYLAGGLTDGLYVIGAGRSLGKTTFCVNLAIELARQKNYVYYFTLHESKSSLIDKSLSYLSYKNDPKLALTQREVMYINNPEFNIKDRDEKYKNLLNCFNEFQTEIEPYFYICDRIGKKITPEIIEEETFELIRAMKKKPIIIIDWLQLLKFGYLTNLSEEEKMDEILTMLMKLSRKQEIPIILISQLGDCRDIKWASDAMIFLEPLDITADEDKNLRLCLSQSRRTMALNIVKNNRRPSEKKISFIYNAAYNHFEEYDNS